MKIIFFLEFIAIIKKIVKKIIIPIHNHKNYKIPEHFKTHLGFNVFSFFTLCIVSQFLMLSGASKIERLGTFFVIKVWELKSHSKHCFYGL